MNSDAGLTAGVCANVIYIHRTTIAFFNSCGSSVFVTSLNIPIAHDKLKLNH